MFNEPGIYIKTLASNDTLFTKVGGSEVKNTF